MDHTGEKMVLRLESRFDYISKIEKKKPPIIIIYK